MELLELEMRARAIKSLLNVETDSPNRQDSAVKPETEEPDTDQPEEKIDGKQKPKSVQQENSEAMTAAEMEKCKKEAADKEIMRKAAAEEKRLQKAREVLGLSEARKREEEEALERKHAEIRLIQKIHKQ